MKFKKSGGFTGILLVLIIAILLIAGIYFVTGSGLLSTSTCECNEAKICDDSAKTVSNSLLTDPMVYEWRGSVKGKLVAKDLHTFTLEYRGNRFTVTDVMAGGKVFKFKFMKTLEDGTAQELALADIPLQTNMIGDFWVLNGGPNTAVGGTYHLMEFE
jgi:hypothetical protein